MDTANIWRVLEVHNFGGFFGGDTVTLTAARWDDGAEETITVDEQALVNVADRHTVTPAMVFDLLIHGQRVDRAELLGAGEWSVLRAALDLPAPAPPLAGPQIRAYHCARCELWINGAPMMEGPLRRCKLCGQALS